LTKQYDDLGRKGDISSAKKYAKKRFRGEFVRWQGQGIDTAAAQPEIVLFSQGDFLYEEDMLSFLLGLS
jgi:hypothetical protein